jgi:lipid A 3-O-deacylase
MNGWKDTMGRAAYATIPILPFFVMAGVAVGNPLTTFKDQPASQKYCQNDTVVWLDLPTHTYYLKGNPWYGLTKNGAYACKAAADQAGFHACDQWNRVIVLEENDSLFFNSDKHYTQGFRLSHLRPEPAKGGVSGAAFDLLGHIPSFFVLSPSDAAANKRQVSLLGGQSIFTPENKTIVPPDPRDRPYAGWAYGGASLLQETALRSEADGQPLGMLENAELDIGLIGPGALGKKVQNDFHQLIGVPQAQGWSSQLQNEPGVVLSYERLWRQRLLGNNTLGVDLVPQVGASVGNIFSYGEAGALLRIGRGLLADYGPIRVRPALSGTDYFDPVGLDNGVGFYYFVGAQWAATFFLTAIPSVQARTEENLRGGCTRRLCGAIEGMASPGCQRLPSQPGVSWAARTRRDLYRRGYFCLVNGISPKAE